MNVRIHLFLISLIVLIGCQPDKNENVFSIGKQDSVQSSTLEETRRFFVYVPPSYEESSDSSNRYPVIYLLDGGSHFHSVTGLLDQLMGNALCPEMIVVAIQNTDRSRDLTPSKSLKMPNGEERDFLKTTGGAENFVRFIETELFPHIEKNYRTAPHRILIGHSFGGLFAIHTMMNHTELFNTYVAIDPSLWWDNRKLLLQTDSMLNQNRFDGRSLFVSVANTMPPGMDTLRVIGDTTGSTSHIRSIIRFSKNASIQSKRNGMNFTWRYYSQDTHGSVPLISEYDALRALFSYYKMPYDPEATAQKYTEHFNTVSTHLGYQMLPPENVVNDHGYNLLQQKKFDLANDFFKLNVKNYPRSANAHDGMGDYFLATGDTLQARDYFSKALLINDSPFIPEKMARLKD